MTDAELIALYAEGNAKSHTAGLRAIYEAGRGHDARVAAAKAADEEKALQGQIAKEDAATTAAVESEQKAVDADLAADSGR